MSSTRDSAASVALVARPIRLIRGVLFALITRVPGGVLVGLLAMWVAASVLRRGLGEGVLAQVGSVSATAALIIAGLIGGALIGVTLAADRILDVVQREIREGFALLPVPQQERLFPAIPLDQLRDRYDAVLQAAFDASVGRLPLPGFARRFVRARFGHELAEAFLAECEAKGTDIVGFPELRDWLLARGVPYAFAPVAVKVRFWRLVFMGIVGALFVLTMAAGLLMS